LRRLVDLVRKAHRAARTRVERLGRVHAGRYGGTTPNDAPRTPVRGENSVMSKGERPEAVSRCSGSFAAYANRRGSAT
jgi:hypothetical protein